MILNEFQKKLDIFYLEVEIFDNLFFYFKIHVLKRTLNYLYLIKL